LPSPGRTERIQGPIVAPRILSAAELEVGAEVAQLLAAERSRGRAAMRELAALRRIELDADETLELNLYPQSAKGFDVKSLLALGLDVVRHRKAATTVRVPLAMVAALPAMVPGLAHLDVPPPAMPFSGEGVIASGGVTAQAKGARGAGTRIGIVDVGYV